MDAFIREAANHNKNVLVEEKFCFPSDSWGINLQYIAAIQMKVTQFNICTVTQSTITTNATSTITNTTTKTTTDNTESKNNDTTESTTTTTILSYWTTYYNY
jgi:hypothetical protein